MRFWIMGEGRVEVPDKIKGFISLNYEMLLNAARSGDQTTFVQARRDMLANLRGFRKSGTPAVADRVPPPWHADGDFYTITPGPSTTIQEFLDAVEAYFLSPPESWHRSIASAQDSPSTAVGATGPRVIDLRKCRVIGVRDLKQVEVELAKERRTYTNSSKSVTLTKEVTISNSVSTTVTIETSKLQALNVTVGCHVVGFPSIQGQIQLQLAQRHAVATENTINLSEKTSIQIPPRTTVEHVIWWKLISYHGVAILGTAADHAGAGLAEVPYQVPQRLTYADDIKDV